MRIPFFARYISRRISPLIIAVLIWCLNKYEIDELTKLRANLRRQDNSPDNLQDFRSQGYWQIRWRRGSTLHPWSLCYFRHNILFNYSTSVTSRAGRQLSPGSRLQRRQQVNGFLAHLIYVDESHVTGGEGRSTKLPSIRFLLSWTEKCRHLECVKREFGHLEEANDT